MSEINVQVVNNPKIRIAQISKRHRAGIKAHDLLIESALVKGTMAQVEILPVRPIIVIMSKTEKPPSTRKSMAAFGQG